MAYENKNYHSTNGNSDNNYIATDPVSPLTQNRAVQVDITTAEISNSIFSISLEELLSRF